MSVDVVSVVCRSQGPTVELGAVAERAQGLYFDRSCGGGWWWGAYTDAEVFDQAREWLVEVEQATGGPALVMLDMDSDCAQVVGRDGLGGWWGVCLIRSEMQVYLDDEDVTVEEMFLSPERGVSCVMEWSVRAGLVPDEDRLRFLLGLEDADPEIGDVTEDFVVALGLQPR